jgi:hypothetical protein
MPVLWNAAALAVTGLDDLELWFLRSPLPIAGASLLTKLETIPMSRRQQARVFRI